MGVYGVCCGNELFSKAAVEDGEVCYAAGAAACEYYCLDVVYANV